MCKTPTCCGVMLRHGGALCNNFKIMTSSTIEIYFKIYNEDQTLYTITITIYTTQVIKSCWCLLVSTFEQVVIEKGDILTLNKLPWVDQRGETNERRFHQPYCTEGQYFGSRMVSLLLKWGIDQNSCLITYKTCQQRHEPERRVKLLGNI